MDLFKINRPSKFFNELMSGDFENKQKETQEFIIKDGAKETIYVEGPAKILVTYE